MEIPTLKLRHLLTERLLLVPYTTEICKAIIDHDFSLLYELGLKKGKGWPDHDVLDTLPRVINNLSQVEAPTGFESWFIVKNGSQEIIGDVGFKGCPHENKPIDIGYGIIREERGNGYALEAAEELIRWAFSQEYVREITAECLVDNISSINLLKKLKFLEIKRRQRMVYWRLENKLYPG